MRNGNLAKASFNFPQSIAIYDKNLTKIKMMSNLKPIYIENKNKDKIECKYMTKENYTACGMIIDQNFPVPIIDHTKVKYVSFAVINATSVEKNYTVEPRIAYIADSANHCIRLLSVASAYVSTVAGVCGDPGLADGPFS